MSSTILSNSMNLALRQVSTQLHDLQGKWLVGGSCGLILQHITLESQPRDLDIYADDADIEVISTLLQNYVVDQPHYSETPIYRSNLSHYLISGVHIELVGNFRVDSGGSHYRVEVHDLLSRYSIDYVASGLHFKLMPLAHELIFNLLRNRADRYEIIAKVMKENLEYYAPALQHIVRRNNLSNEHLDQLSHLLELQLL